MNSSRARSRIAAIGSLGLQAKSKPSRVASLTKWAALIRRVTFWASRRAISSSHNTCRSSACPRGAGPGLGQPRRQGVQDAGQAERLQRRGQPGRATQPGRCRNAGQHRLDHLMLGAGDQDAAHRAVGRVAGQGGHDPRVAEPQGRGPPTVLEGWPRDPLKGWARKDTALADTESIDHATVDVTGLGPDFGQVLDPPRHTEVGGVVEDGLDAERPAVFEVGLHPGVPEVGVEGDLVAGAQQPGPVAARWWGADPATEDDPHLFRAADVEVVGAQRLEEPPGLPRRVEHDGARDLDLAHGDVPPVAAGPVGVGQRQRQPGPPALAEHRDGARPQALADLARPGRVVGGGEPVVQFGEPDPRRGRRAFGVLVAVQPFS
jgi:hypothetical protein